MWKHNLQSKKTYFDKSYHIAVAYSYLLHLPYQASPKRYNLHYFIRWFRQRYNDIIGEFELGKIFSLVSSVVGEKRNEKLKFFETYLVDKADEDFIVKDKEREKPKSITLQQLKENIKNYN